MEMISKIQQSDSAMNPPKCSNIRNSCPKIPTPPFTTRATIPYLSPRYDSIPTTYVHADPSTFKQVVQMLTGTTTKTEQPPPQPPSQPPQQDHSSPLRNFNIPPRKQVTPLLNDDDPFEKSSPFFRTITHRDSKPKLLPLFPVTSRVSESSSS
ncbi:unnamed protein product [Lupinus luteus]|uniref:VQ domain-containing protein n=1 Tax=Lupinus luteus TaxID=3873 RepID=A0AAV1WNT1_LUPLU